MSKLFSPLVLQNFPQAFSQPRRNRQRGMPGWSPAEQPRSDRWAEQRQAAEERAAWALCCLGLASREGLTFPGFTEMQNRLNSIVSKSLTEKVKLFLPNSLKTKWHFLKIHAVVSCSGYRGISFAYIWIKEMERSGVSLHTPAGHFGSCCYSTCTEASARLLSLVGRTQWGVAEQTGR